VPVEVAFDALYKAGFDDETAVYAFHTLIGYVLGYVLQELGGPFGTRTGAFAAAYDRMPATGYPRIRVFLPTGADPDPDREFEFGLDTVLNGLAARLP